MVYTRPPITESSSPFSNTLVSVPNVPITIGIIVSCMFHSFSVIVIIIIIYVCVCVCVCVCVYQWNFSLHNLLWFTFYLLRAVVRKVIFMVFPTELE